MKQQRETIFCKRDLLHMKQQAIFRGAATVAAGATADSAATVPVMQDLKR